MQRRQFLAASAGAALASPLAGWTADAWPALPGRSR
jgi:hypothetical protein